MSLYHNRLHAQLYVAAALLVQFARAAEPVVLEVSPSTVRLDGPRATCQLVVTGRTAEGRPTDLTAETTVEPCDLVAPEPHAFLRAAKDGFAQLTIRAGKLAAQVPVTVTGATVARSVGFRLEVVPALNVGGCNQGACHGAPAGKNGFRLSLRGSDPQADFLALTRDQFGRRADRLDPAASLVLRKTLGTVPHDGGPRLREGALPFERLRAWLTGGAPDDVQAPPRVVGLDVLPGPRLLTAPARHQQLAVAARFADGSSRDVTRLTVFSTSDAATATVGDTGRVEFHRTGEVAILCRYLEALRSVRLTYVAPRADFVWPEPPAVHPVDKAVASKLELLQIAPSRQCTDPEFLRRVTLDLAGRLPTPDEVRAFLAETDADKRTKVIDQLLASPEFADYWTLKWADLLRVGRKAMRPKGALALHGWLRARLAANVPFDAVARELLTAAGSSATEPAANFYRVARDPQVVGEAAAQLFCGVRLQCAKCHNHPFERWTQDDYYGFAAYFARVRTKPDTAVTSAKGQPAAAEIVFSDRAGEVAHPRTGQAVQPRPLGSDATPGDGDRRVALADWLTAADNPFFARSVANRVWYHLFGRGVVEPADDFRDSNPASHDAVLDVLARGFVDSKFDFRALARTVVSSQTYQRSATPTPSNADDVRHFARAVPRPLTAEQLLDAVCDVTGVPEKHAGFPAGTRAVQLPDGEDAHPFLKAFGQPARELVCECERDAESNLGQALQLAVGPTLAAKVRAADGRLSRLLAAEADAAVILRELTLAAFGRPATEAEVRTARGHVARAKSARLGWEDVLWALLNSQEFLFRR